MPENYDSHAGGSWFSDFYYVSSYIKNIIFRKDIEQGAVALANIFAGRQPCFMPK